MQTLLHSANLESIRIETLRQSNAQAKSIEGLVTVFVGGTNGIGESTAKELFLRTTRPKAYIIGRSEERGHSLVSQLKEINSDGQAIFLKRDISLLRDVDELCAELKGRESKINCLFLTAGYMTLRGRSETAEGLDHKMCVNYYSRMRCTLNLMPLLTTASEANEISRVITVLAAGSEDEIRLDDLDLKHNFTLHACLAHCVVFADFMIEQLAERYPGTSFSHSYPGTVKTGIANQLTGPVRLAVKLMYAVMTPWILNIQESGERHFFQITSKCYPAKNGSAGIPIPEGLSVIRGIHGTRGSGAYLLDWDSKAAGDERILSKYRSMDLGTTVWNHTMAMFAQAEQRRRMGSKRSASEDADGARRSIPDPVGWRPA